MADIFKALADPTRRDILILVAKRPHTINSIAEEFDHMSRPAVSKHIRMLKECNLIEIKQGNGDSRQRICHLHIQALKEVHDYMTELERFWKNKLTSLGEYLDQEGTNTQEINQEIN